MQKGYLYCRKTLFLSTRVICNTGFDKYADSQSQPVRATLGSALKIAAVAT
ncbi:MAG: hypothetical protein JWQ40_529 [Segetibacter sp.]|nr:hypothetical protein [Segetibacter sp.]